MTLVLGDRRGPKHRSLGTPESRGAAYLTWRQTIPFSDKQIADALIEEARETGHAYLERRLCFWAGAARRGVIYGKAFSIAIKRLIRVCSLCGKTALYRVGCQGRCREHRLVSSVEARERKQRQEARSTQHEQERKQDDVRVLTMKAAVARRRSLHQKA